MEACEECAGKPGAGAWAWLGEDGTVVAVASEWEVLEGLYREAGGLPLDGTPAPEGRRIRRTRRGGYAVYGGAHGADHLCPAPGGVEGWDSYYAPLDPSSAAVPSSPAPPFVRAVGAAHGHLLGDILGAPHEFCKETKDPQGLGRYSRAVVTTTSHHQYQAPRTTALGQGTDDTEFSMAVLRLLAAHGPRWNEEAAIAMYQETAQAGRAFLGKNTKAIFGSGKTRKAYDNHVAALFPPGGDRKHGARGKAQTWSQGNGALMRAYPFVLLADDEWEDAAVADCEMTSRGPWNVGAALAYGHLLRWAVYAAPRPYDTRAARAAVEAAVDRAVAGVRDRGVALDAAEVADVEGELRAVVHADAIPPAKGWAYASLYCAFRAATMPSTDFAGALERVIKWGGDTDTNGAIAGAILGARFAETMHDDPVTAQNVALALACDTLAGDHPRSPRATPAGVTEGGGGLERIMRHIYARAHPGGRV
jgi:ADP-ribosyl-[dinitrogen reductase] hydrolase